MGYVELDVEVRDKVVPHRGVVIVKEPPCSRPSSDVPGVLGMNVIITAVQSAWDSTF